jgi:chromate reductase, NAD(P)H dehydrogenase (quinone)
MGPRRRTGALAVRGGTGARAVRAVTLPYMNDQPPRLPKILGLCGSLRKTSSNLALLEAARRLAPGNVEVVVAAPLDRLPHFNPDLDIDPAPDSVARWRREVSSAHAVLICSPEYAFSIPGTLKNALDWLVSSGELYEKPLALITASPNHGGAARAQAHLIDTLRAQQVAFVEEAHVSVPFVRKRFDALGNLIDDDIARALVASVSALANAAPGPD